MNILVPADTLSIPTLPAATTDYLDLPFVNVAPGTHGGLNTVLESLSVGVPLVVIPVTSDQPGVGARVESTGTGKAIPVQHLTTRNLRSAIRHVLEVPAHRKAAQFLQTRIADGNGLEQAADIVEKALVGKSMLGIY
jgi:UDP:flavonoid glycosyltransferase YjiC (YdhE family)